MTNDERREEQPDAPADATRQLTLDRYRVHLMWTASELDRPYSLRTDVWSTSPHRAGHTAASMLATMAQETALHDVEVLATMSVERVPDNLPPRRPDPLHNTPGHGFPINPPHIPGKKTGPQG